MNRWGELWEKSHRQVWTEAAVEAVEDAGVDHVDSIYVGNMSGGQFVGQEHLGPLMADHLGMTGTPAALAVATSVALSPTYSVSAAGTPSRLMTSRSGAGSMPTASPISSNTPARSSSWSAAGWGICTPSRCTTSDRLEP
jgi:acetyl-CoA C-acetyltransferase